MEPLTDDDFEKFIIHFREKTYEDENHRIHYCYNTATELSRSDTEDADPVVINSQCMYGMDWMVKSSKRLNKQPSKSTDALFISYDENGNLNLHIIEFKFVGRKSYRDKMNNLWRDVKRRASCEEFKIDEEKCFDDFFVENFKRIKNNFHDPVEVSLQLKPYESIFITLPELYYEYCEDRGCPKKDIKSYLSTVKKYYWSFVRTRSQYEGNIKSRTDKFNRYNQRLERTIFIKARAKPWHKFNGTLKYEILGNPTDDDYLDKWSKS